MLAVLTLNSSVFLAVITSVTIAHLDGGTSGYLRAASGMRPVGLLPRKGAAADGTTRFMGRWAGMVATRESHPELPSYSPTSPNLPCSTSSGGARPSRAAAPTIRVYGRPAGVPAIISSPTQSPQETLHGMQVDSDGDWAHEFMIEDVRTGQLRRRCPRSPTLTLSGTSISSGSLRWSVATSAKQRDMHRQPADGVPGIQESLADTDSAPGSPSSVPTLPRTPRRGHRPSSFFAMRVRRSPLPSPPRRQGTGRVQSGSVVRTPTRDPSCTPPPRAAGERSGIRLRSTARSCSPSRSSPLRPSAKRLRSRPRATCQPAEPSDSSQDGSEIWHL